MLNALKDFQVVSDTDGNVFFPVKARDEFDAALEALEQLGWFVKKTDSQELADPNQYEFNF